MNEIRKKEIENELMGTRKLFVNGNLDDAQKKIDRVIDSLSSDELIKEDKRFEYLDFKNPIEEGLYRVRRRDIYSERDEERRQLEDNEENRLEDDVREERADEKEIKLVEYPVSNLFVLCASIALQRGDYGKALESLEEAMEWNPISPEIAFEYAETVKRMGAIDQFFTLTKRNFQNIYSSGQLGHAYRNAAYYYETSNESKKALAMLAFSTGFDDNENAKREINAILKEDGKDHIQISIDDVKKICDEDDIPFGPDPLVIKLSSQNGMYFMQDKNYQMAYYFLSIAYDLTRDPAIKNKLDEIADQIKDKQHE